MEFLYRRGPHFIKGFIDLVFCYRDTLYFLDWKTNFLNGPLQAALQEEMQAHDYYLQASLYAEAITRYLGAQEKISQKFGGAFYLFVRHGLYTHCLPKSLEGFRGR